MKGLQIVLGVAVPTVPYMTRRCAYRIMWLVD